MKLVCILARAKHEQNFSLVSENEEALHDWHTGSRH